MTRIRYYSSLLSTAEQKRISLHVSNNTNQTKFTELHARSAIPNNSKIFCYLHCVLADSEINQELVLVALSMGINQPERKSIICSSMVRNSTPKPHRAS